MAFWRICSTKFCSSMVKMHGRTNQLYNYDSRIEEKLNNFLKHVFYVLFVKKKNITETTKLTIQSYFEVVKGIE